MSKGLTFIFKDEDINVGDENNKKFLKVYDSITLFNVNSFSIFIIDDSEFNLTVSNKEKTISVDFTFDEEEVKNNPIFNITSQLENISLYPKEYRTICITRRLKDNTGDKYVFDFTIFEKHREYASVYDAVKKNNDSYSRIFTPQQIVD